MALLSWKREYSVGVKELDYEHMNLINLANELFNKIEAGNSIESISAVLNELINTVIVHFSHEEQLFIKYSYPESAVHRSQHKELVDKIVAYKNVIESSNSELLTGLMDFLRNWLIDHIEKSDKNYIAFFKNKGVS